MKHGKRPNPALKRNCAKARSPLARPVRQQEASAGDKAAALLNVGVRIKRR